MRNKAGTGCMVLGLALILGAMVLFVHNQTEAAAAQQASDILLPQLMDEIESEKEATDEEPIPVQLEQPEIPIEILEPEDLEMKEVEIDGYAYIGYLSIPCLNLELPVMADWDYDRLKIAPCRYMGSVRGEDLVIMAHNYSKHFGYLSDLSQGDQIFFTDMNGAVTGYEVVARDVLDPYAVDEVTSGDFDLTLFTCTYGGRSRVTVYCDRSKNGDQESD